MPAVKDVLRHLTTEVAGKKRKCYRHPTKHVISKGELCLVVKDGPQDQSTYCLICAREILELARVRLSDLTVQTLPD
ncbi:MAG: hypothetical protein HY997_23620 [Mycolicibacterium neoaurum]|nr:hypothetical protein [Mycolicibacterium neoaurum]